MLSIIVPALDESQSISALVSRIGRTLAGKEYEILVVDGGSKDNTVQIASRLSSNFPIRVFSLPGKSLQGSVLEGIRQSKGRFLCVMDADLSHPPEEVPKMLKMALEGSGIVIGSRFVSGASFECPLWKRLLSMAASLAAKPVSGVNDGMSGFFLVKRDVLHNSKIKPISWKILFEILSTHRGLRAVERPIRFIQRKKGRSKMGFRQGFLCALHIFWAYARIIAARL